MMGEWWDIGIGFFLLFVLPLFPFFIPLRYRIEADENGTVVSFTYLFGLIRKRWCVKPSKNGKEIEGNRASLLLRKWERFKEKQEQKEKHDSEKPEDEGKRPSSWDVFSYAWENGTVRLIFEAIRKILRHSRFSKSYLGGRIGLGDPMQTGILAGLCYACFPKCQVEWDYVNRCTAYVFWAKGRIIPFYILHILITLAWEKPVRQTILYRRRASWTTPQENNFSKNLSK